MRATTTCENPKCSCDPCTCADCGCGAASLGELERRVIDVLWEEPRRERSGRDVADVLPGYAYTTLSTVLDRLTQKGLVTRRMDGRTIRFAATGTRADHTADVMHDALVTAREPESTLVRFTETLSPAEADILRRALDELDGRRPGPG